MISRTSDVAVARMRQWVFVSRTRARSSDGDFRVKRRDIVHNANAGNLFMWDRWFSRKDKERWWTMASLDHPVWDSWDDDNGQWNSEVLKA